MKKIITLTLLVFSFAVSAQRIVFPGQDLIFPHLNDPSYIGVSGDVTAMGMLQITDYERKQHSQFVNAQLPVSENLSFGVDYFKDAVDYYNYSTAMASMAYKINVGGDQSYIRVGVSAGIDSRRQDRFPIDEIPNMEEFVPRINESSISFTYRAGIHYNWNNFTIGGSYNRLPIQSVLARNNIEDIIGYWIEEGFTANVRYGFNISETFRLTPVLRYLSYANDPIYEGALLIDVGNYVSASVSYKDDYSINPAIRFELFDALQIGYSYEKSMGSLTFEDIHSLSILYKINSDGAVQSEWMQNAESTNKKIKTIKPVNAEKEEKRKIKAAEKEKEAARKVKAAEKAEKATQKQAEEAAAAQQKAAQKEADANEAAERKAVEQELAQQKAEQKEAEAAAQRKATEQEIALQKTEQKEADAKEAAQRELAAQEMAQREAEQKEASDKEATAQEQKTDPVVISKPIKPRFEKDGSVMKKGYYIIVKTFDTMAKAETEKHRLSKLDYYTAIGTKKDDKSYYLYIDFDSDGANAQKRLRAHKLDSNFRKATLLKVD